MAKGKLTPKQIKYCRERAAGKDYAAAYTAAGYSDKAGKQIARNNAYHMEKNNSDILARIKALQDRADAGGIMNRQQRMQLLNDIALDPAVKEQDRLRAIDQLNRMNADYSDTLNVNSSGTLQLSYTDRLQAIQDAMQD